MSNPRPALNADRLHKALELESTEVRKTTPVQRLSIEKGSILENTDRLTLEESSLTSTNMGYMDSVVEDYLSDLEDLERSINEYKEYLRKLTEKEKAIR